MNDKSNIKQLSRIAAWGVAFAYFSTSILAVLMPPELQASLDVTPHEFWTILSRDPMAHLAFHWAWVVCGILGLAAVPGIALLAWESSKKHGIILWSTCLALIGFVVHARSHLMEVSWDRKIIALYENADPAFQEAVHVVAGLALDVPDGLLTYAGIGVWILVISLNISHLSQKPLLYKMISFAAVVSLFAGTLGYMFLIRPFIILSFVLGTLITIPLWFIWTGFLVRDPAKFSNG